MPKKTKEAKVLGEFKRGTLRSSSGRKVTSRTQAVAIALSEARKAREGKLQDTEAPPPPKKKPKAPKRVGGSQPSPRRLKARRNKTSSSKAVTPSPRRLMERRKRKRK